MLTDYHLHLRPDTPGSTAASHFTPANAERYRIVAGERGIEELGVSEHVYRFAQALDVWSHELWRREAVDDLDAYCSFVLEQTDLRLGIEADWVPGREDRMATLLDARPFDYVVGSVHFLGDRSIDHPDWDVWEGDSDPDRVWARYFDAVGQAATSGLFDVLAHADLVKVWGRGRPAPSGDRRRFYEPAVQAIAEAGIAVELSTAGLRKPARELYPAPALLALCVEAGCPIALSSDAHVAGDVGAGYQHALELLEQLGVEELCVFEGRQRRMAPIG